jgi:F-type H+-transporting ATPase subunit b
MRKLLTALSLLLLSASPAFAAAAAEGGANLLSPKTGLIFWTIVVFIIVFLVLRKTAFGPILAAVQAREQAITDAMAAAERDRNEAAKLVAEQKAAIEAARNEAQRFIAEGKATAESMRSEMLEATRQQQAELLERARKEIEGEKSKALDEIRKEAVDLALAGAGKLISQKLDSDADRKLVETYLNSLGK